MKTKLSVGFFALALALALAAPGTPARAEKVKAGNAALSDGVLTACADPYIYPASVQGDPPGYDIEILRAIARANNLRADYVWVDTGTRGGLGKALRNSISKGHCELFLGIAVSDEQIDELAEKNLTFTHPYMALSFILVVQGKSASALTLADLRGVKIGVPMSTPIDGYLWRQGHARELYLGDRRVMQGMAKGEIDAAMVWSPSLAVAKQEFPDGAFHAVPDYLPDPTLRWNTAMVVPKAETELKQFLDANIDRLVKSGEVKRIVESYGAPYFPPFE